MENRRPPRPNTPGAKPFSDRGPRPDGSRRSGFARDANRGPGSRSSGPNDRFQSRDRNGSSGRWSEGSAGKGQGKFDPRSRFGPKKHTKPAAPVEVKEPITSDTQLTDGKFRGKELSYSDSPSCGPTPRKLREVLFKVVSRRVKAGRFLDLGAGAGTMGLEAISRGAMAATFVERSARKCSFLRKNIETLGVKDGHSETFEGEILPFLKQMARRNRCWDLVFLGTRDKDAENEILDRLGKGTAIERGGLLLIEHSSDREFPEKLGILNRWRTIVNGFTTITFYERK